MLQFARPIARAIERSFPCQRCGLAVIGLEVPHAHLHIVPIQNADDLNFTRPKLKPGPDELEAARQKILSNLEA
jgi:histidine triad (HIT) family protein